MDCKLIQQINLQSIWVIGKKDSELSNRTQIKVKP